MKQLSEVQSLKQCGVVPPTATNANALQHRVDEDNIISDQKQLMTFNNNNHGASNANGIGSSSASMLPTKSMVGLHLSFVANANESVSSANCKQCQIGKYD